jgi:hypothetical protein
MIRLLAMYIDESGYLSDNCKLKQSASGGGYNPPDAMTIRLPETRFEWMLSEQQHTTAATGAACGLNM